MMAQLSFDLPIRAARGRDDFFVSDANAVAVALIDTMAQWPMGKLMILGPTGAGKTHLLDIWASDQDAQHWSPDWAHLPDAGARVAIDDVTAYAHDMAAQTALFHLHNHIVATGGALLFTARIPIAQAGFTLPDLRSRLESTTVARIDAPDDTLLQAVMHKHFADRQVFPTPSAMAYLLRNIDRSFETVGRVVDALDRQSLNEGRKITRTMVKRVLADW
ncbi:MAG: DnaA/Hda family protein [Pseudomonadota bacterium]